MKIIASTEAILNSTGTDAADMLGFKPVLAIIAQVFGPRWCNVVNI